MAKGKNKSVVKEVAVTEPVKDGERALSEVIEESSYFKQQLDEANDQVALLLERFNVMEQENQELLDQLEAVGTNIQGVTLTARSVRDEMLMAMLANVGLEYPQSNAQRAMEAVDTIMEVWKIK